MKATVKVENLKIYAYHGCMKEEKIIGSDYVVNVTAECFLENEAFNDDMSKTVDYVDLARIVSREMSVRSKMLESEGVDGITVHPRSRSQRYEGNSKWSIIKQVVESVEIPVTGNGDVKSYDDAKRMIEFTKCKSVMIGRGAIGNPWVFNNSLEKLSYEEKDLYKKKTIINHLQQIKNYFPKKNLDMQIKKNLSYYAKGFYNSREIRQKIFRSSDSIENVIELFFKLFDKNVEKNKLEKISV